MENAISFFYNIVKFSGGGASRNYEDLSGNF